MIVRDCLETDPEISLNVYFFGIWRGCCWQVWKWEEKAATNWFVTKPAPTGAPEAQVHEIPLGKSVGHARCSTPTWDEEAGSRWAAVHQARCGFSILPSRNCQLRPLSPRWSRWDSVTGSDSMQMSPGKILNQDRPMLVRNVSCLHACGISEISLMEGTVPIHTYVTAEIRKLGWTQIKKGPWIPNQGIWIFNSKDWLASREAGCWERTVPLVWNVPVAQSGADADSGGAQTLGSCWNH